MRGVRRDQDGLIQDLRSVSSSTISADQHAVVLGCATQDAPEQLRIVLSNAGWS